MIRDKIKRTPVIDLTGPDGNAYVLLGMAKSWARDLGLDFDPINEEATSGDYENLLQVLDRYFGDVVIFER
jgi:hypothetical protein